MSNEAWQPGVPARWTAGPSTGARIAARLRRSPVYVDPSLAEALPPRRRARLLAAIDKSPIPIFVIVVPLVQGGRWSDSAELATVAHDHLGRDGAYVTLGGNVDGTLRAHQWGGGQAQRENTRWAAAAVFHQDDMRDAALADRLVRCVQLIAAGNGRQVYQRETADLRERREGREGGEPGTASAEPAPAAESGDGGFPTGSALGVAGLVAAAVAGLVLWRHRRTSAARQANPLLLGPSVFATAERATEDELREQASREVVALGELLDASEITGTDPRVRRALSGALDAYQAAGKTLDSARGIPDLAGVLVLVDKGRDDYAAARSLAAGGPEEHPTPLCFFNPLHGESVRQVTWRRIGTRDRLKVRACGKCATAVQRRRSPEVLLDDGRPYFDADPARSVWAETGYGQLRGDLVHRVLRGDLRG